MGLSEGTVPGSPHPRALRMTDNGDGTGNAVVDGASIPTKSNGGVGGTITPSDVTDLSLIATKGIVIGGAGSLVFQLVGDAASTTVPVTAGQYFPGQFKFIKAATTATAIVALGG